MASKIIKEHFSWLTKLENDIHVRYAGLNLWSPVGPMAPLNAVVRKWNKNSRIYLAGRFDLMANQLGRRYECDSCGTTVLCTKAGDGVIRCCGSDMELQQPRKLPSSD